MGPGFKYHVVTVAAIFFALTVGLVVGSLYISPQLAEQQTNAIRDIRTTLEQDNAVQKQKNRHYEECLSSITPSLLHGRLTGARVAIVQTGDYPEATNAAKEVLQMAGATLLSVTTIEHAFNLPDERLNPELAALHATNPRFPTDREGLALALATILTQGDPLINGLLPDLKQAGYINAEADSDYQTPAQYVVVVVGSSTESFRPKNVDQPLVTALQKQGATVIACEPENVFASDIDDYRALNIDVTTVDNVDSDIGRITLVLALQADKNDYGVKPTAKRLLPPAPTKSN